MLSNNRKTNELTNMNPKIYTQKSKNFVVELQYLKYTQPKCYLDLY